MITFVNFATSVIVAPLLQASLALAYSNNTIPAGCVCGTEAIALRVLGYAGLAVIGICSLTSTICICKRTWVNRSTHSTTTPEHLLHPQTGVPYAMVVRNPRTNRITDLSELALTTIVEETANVYVTGLSTRQGVENPVFEANLEIACDLSDLSADIYDTVAGDSTPNSGDADAKHQQAFSEADAEHQQTFSDADVQHQQTFGDVNVTHQQAVSKADVTHQQAVSDIDTKYRQALSEGVTLSVENSPIGLQELDAQLYENCPALYVNSSDVLLNNILADNSVPNSIC